MATKNKTDYTYKIEEDDILGMYINDKEKEWINKENP
jgi:hypothetical protein